MPPRPTLTEVGSSLFSYHDRCYLLTTGPTEGFADMEPRDHGNTIKVSTSNYSTFEGWPLGLEPLNFRMRVLETLRFAEGNDFQSFKTPALTSESSSEFATNTQSVSSSFFREKPITLGEILGLSTNLSARFASNSFGSVEFIDDVANVRNGKGWWNLIGCADEKTRTKIMKGWWGSISCGCAKSCKKSSNLSGISVKSLLDDALRVHKIVKINEDEKVYNNLVFEDTSWSFSNENPLFFPEEVLAFATDDLIDP